MNAAPSSDPERDETIAEPIDLPTVLRLAGARSLDIQIARQRVEEAHARHRGAVQEFFPWLSPGFTYRRHAGLIQGTDGDIIDVRRYSDSPAAALAVQADVGAALFRSRETSKLAAAEEGGLEARRAETLLGAVEGYLELARAQASARVAEEALHLSREYEQQIQRAVEVGLALKGDALRVRTQSQRADLALRQAIVSQRLAAARLAETLHLDPNVALAVRDAELSPLSIVDAGSSAEPLVQKALAGRPEVSAAQVRIGAARDATDAVTIGPLIPSVGAAALVGALGGGKVDGPRRFGGSRDYVVTVGWRLGPGGLLDAARIQGSRARFEAARLEAEKVRQRVAREVVEAWNRVRSLGDQMASAKEGLAAASEALRLSQQRAEFGIAAVLERILAEQDLTRARNDYVTVVAEYDKAQYELLRAIGGITVDSAPLP